MTSLAQYQSMIGHSDEDTPDYLVPVIAYRWGNLAGMPAQAIDAGWPEPVAVHGPLDCG